MPEKNRSHSGAVFLSRPKHTRPARRLAPDWSWQAMEGWLTHAHYFHSIGNMESQAAVLALEALAQTSRLEIFRLLVSAGPGGLAAGTIAEKLALPNATLSFHLAQLKNAGLIQCQRQSRSLIYSADFDAMTGLLSFLTENCCQGKVAQCIPIGNTCKPTSRRRNK